LRHCDNARAGPHQLDRRNRLDQEVGDLHLQQSTRGFGVETRGNHHHRRVLAETAATREHAHLGQVVHHYLARLDPDGAEPDPTEGRTLSMTRHADGSLQSLLPLRREHQDCGA